MPSRFRSLVVSADDDFREELVERAISLNFSVRAIRLPDELPRLMRRYGFEWLILDLALGESGCLQIIERLAAESPPPRVILVDGRSEAEVRAITRMAAQNGLEVAGIASRPLSLPKLRELTSQSQADDEPAESSNG